MNLAIRTKWPTAKVGDLCDVSRGSSPRPIKDQRYFEGGTIPWIKIADATKSGKFLYETKQYVNEYGASFSRLLPPGTILVAASGTLGYTQILGVQGCAHDGWLILTNLRDFDRDFAYYTLQLMERYFYNAAYGAAIQNINTEILRETLIPHPPILTQRKIASILSTYDDMLKNNLRRIKILENMAQNLYREWFVKFRFPGHEKVRMVDSQLGEIPEGWKMATLGDVSNIIPGYAFKSKDWSENGISVIKIKNIRPENLIDTEKIDHVPEDILTLKHKKYWVRHGDILIAMTGATAGKIGKLRSKRPMLLNQRVAKIDPIMPYKEYVWCSVSNPEAERGFYALADGAAQPNMSGTQIENTKLLLPDIEVLQKFNDLISSKIKYVDNLILSNFTLRQTRDLLLPRLISGELDVSELDIKIPEEVA
ncbi:MAG: restriction endonuclease subunit S [Thermodesulfobacteriota bacterium]